MDYAEFHPPEALMPLAKLAWTLSVPDSGREWSIHTATPDGCMEIIRRSAGRSRWNGEQPEVFVAGMLTRPAELQLGAGGRFVGLRLWPWAWRLISGRSPAALVDSWAPLDAAASDFRMPHAIEDIFEAVSAYPASPQMRRMAGALSVARKPADLSRLTGMSARGLQRWFETHVGQPPQSYLRMVRFGDAFAHLPTAEAGLAGHAADYGFADQAHMAREFRSLAGAPPRSARLRGQGPFIDPEIDRN